MWLFSTPITLKMHFCSSHSPPSNPCDPSASNSWLCLPHSSVSRGLPVACISVSPWYIFSHHWLPCPFLYSHFTHQQTQSLHNTAVCGVRFGLAVNGLESSLGSGWRLSCPVPAVVHCALSLPPTLDYQLPTSTPVCQWQVAMKRGEGVVTLSLRIKRLCFGNPQTFLVA